MPASAGDLVGLDTAIDLLRQALGAAPDRSPDRVSWLSDLGFALQGRFERTGNLADLDGAITASQQAITATPDNHPELLANLGIALTRRFERTGHADDLDAAITATEQAITAIPDNHPDRASGLVNLGVALTRRFERTGHLADLDAGITACQQAVAATPDDHPNRAGYLSNLSIALKIRFKRSGNPADLDIAITASQQAVAATPDDHPNRAMMLNNLGLILQDRCARSGNPADLNAAIIVGQQAIAAAPDDHPGTAARLSNLSLALVRRFETAGNLADLDAAVGLIRRAEAAVSADDADRAHFLFNLGLVLKLRFDQAGDPADLDAAFIASQQAVAITAAAPRVRAQAGMGWGHAAAAGKRWPEAAAGFGAVADLLGLVAPRGLSRSDQEHLLGELGTGVGADAAACCVRAGLTGRAVELFEQCRAVLLGQALDTRTDLTALIEQHPGLAARFTALRDNLDQANAAGINRVIAEIRDLPGFGGFLRPPPLDELLAAAEEGPIVIGTVSDFGAYALIVTGSGVLDPVPLTGLTPQAVYDQVAGFLAALDDARLPTAGPDGRTAAEQQLSSTLGWLWDELAGPVLSRLGFTGRPRDGQKWPRLWWCLSGLLSFLPVHAAGHHHTHGDANPETVLDRVVSSYTPTIRALAHARRPRPAAATGDQQQARVVAIAMPQTPGAGPLPGASREAAWLQEFLPGQVSLLTGPEATRSAVLAALPARRWAHFACHGSSNPANPSENRLLLTDHHQRPLTIADVARLRLDDAELAFLSACSTARPDGPLADEAIHLASAFQLAGYRHVIATMWPIRDKPAADIAASIYTSITAASGEPDMASAVNTAARLMRQRWGHDKPSAWASHIHAGA